MNDPLTIWLIGDGKPGHENQSLGLAEAIGRLRPVEVRRIELSGAGGFLGRWRSAIRQSAALPLPDLIIAAGHATHWPLWRLGRRTGAPTVVLMRPSLPLGCFDFCLAPRHDFDGEPQRDGLILTEGALNRVIAGGTDAKGRLVLVGGPSKSHDWDEVGMIRALAEVVEGEGWQLTDSRRTPPGFLAQVAHELPQLGIHPHGETGPDWLPRTLRQAGEVWVSEDSVSMVYEALSSGARVGLLPVPRRTASSRVLRGLDRLLEEGRITSLSGWRERGRELPPARPLREADRCAALVLERLPSAG